MVGSYKVYNDANLINKYNDKIQKLLFSCKNTLKDTLQLEDYEEEGVITVSALKEAFQTLDIDIDEELMDYVLFVVYQKSESTERMNYLALFDLIDGKIG